MDFFFLVVLEMDLPVVQFSIKAKDKEVVYYSRFCSLNAYHFQKSGRFRDCQVFTRLNFFATLAKI